jgi:hypothetical protein
MCPLVGKTYETEIGGTDILFYGETDVPHEFKLLDLARKWYQTALNVPNDDNPLMGDDLDGIKNKNFLVSLGKSFRLLICGGSWEKPALRKENENKTFVRKAVIDTKTLVFVSIINVILLPGGHQVREYIDNDENRKKAFDQMNEAMDIEKVFARFKISGPYPSRDTTTGIFLNKDDLLKISTPLEEPFKDIRQNSNLETDPPEWKTLPIKYDFPAYTSGYYACFELRTPGTYLIEIDGSAPLAGHQDDHKEEALDQKVVEDSPFGLEETLFHNSSTYELEVK